MVEENFKLNINLQLDQSGLADLQKQIERAVKQAFDKATRNIKVPALGTTEGGPTTATARSARQAISVSGKDIGKEIQQAIRDDLQGFEKAAQRMEQAVDRLTKALEKDISAAKSGNTPTRRTGGSSESTEAASTSNNIVKRLEQIAKVLQTRTARVQELKSKQERVRPDLDIPDRGERENKVNRQLTKLDKEIEQEQRKILRATQLEQSLKSKALQTSQQLERSEAELTRANQNLAKAREKEAATSAKSVSRKTDIIPTTPVRSVTATGTAPKVSEQRSLTERPSSESTNIARRLEQVAKVLQSRAERIQGLKSKQENVRPALDIPDRDERENKVNRQLAKLDKEIEQEQRKALRTVQLEQRLKAKALQTAQTVQSSEEELIKANQKLAKAREKEAAATTTMAQISKVAEVPTAQVPKATRTSGPKEKLAPKQTGPSNQQTGANIDVTRQAGSQRTAGGDSSGVVTDSPRISDKRVGTVQDRPNFGEEARKRVEAREGAGQQYVQGAEVTLGRASASLSKLEQVIRQIPKYREADLSTELGLPTGLSIGRGGAPIAELPSGQQKVITQTVDIGNDENGKTFVRTGDIITRRVDELLGSDKLAEISKTSRFRPERGQAMLREEIRNILQLPKLEENQVGGGFSTAGQAEIRFSPNEEQIKRIRSKPEGAVQLSETVAILHEMASASSAFKEAGLEVVTVVGLAEDKASDLAGGIKTMLDLLKEGIVTPIEGTVQTRNLADMGVGGAGVMRQARSFLMTQAVEMVGGEEPKIKGIGEEAVYAGDLFGKQAVKHLKTAIVASDLIPETKEDQFLVDKAATEGMGTLESKFKVVKEVGEDIVPGMMLQDKQVIGTNAEGAAVEFDLKGAQAQVKEIERIVVNGTEAWKVRYAELNELVSGAKISTRAGGKGIIRVIEDLAGTFGLPEGTQVAMSAEGMAKRGDLRTFIEMNAGNIAKETGTDPQVAADMVVDRMKVLGETLDTAVKTVAAQLGIKNYTGAEIVTEGPLAKASGGQAAVSTGEVAFLRLPREGQRGEGKVKPRFLDKAGIESMKQRAETNAQARAMQVNTDKVIEKNKEYIYTLLALAGATDKATAGLKEVRPEQFQALEPGIQDPSALEGTILDPKMAEALKLILPTRGGGEEAIRLPAQGKGLGRREVFETELGQVGASPVSKLFDKLIQQAKQIRVATGQVDLKEDAETYGEAAQITSRAIKDQVSEIIKLGAKTEEGKAAIARFLEDFTPFVNALEGSANIKYEKVRENGERVLVEDNKAPAEYLASRPDDLSKVFAIQDLLAERSAKRTELSPKSGLGRQGFVATQNVPRMGAIFDPKNADMLTAVMDKLGVSLTENSDHVEELYSRLEGLRFQLENTLADLAPGTGSSGVLPVRRPYAQAAGGGFADAPTLVATEFRTDITEPLEKARERLEQLRAAGHNVDVALAAVERIAALQVDIEAIPRDAVLLNRKDYDNLKNSIMKNQRIGSDEAEQRLERGISLRYPVTGGQSNQVVKILKEETGAVGEGKVGASGPFAGAPADVAAVVGELENLRSSLVATIEENKGFGAAADAARQEIAALDPIIGAFRQSFLSATQNLDFDGDKLAIFGALSEEAAKSLRTFTETARSGAISLEDILNSLLTSSTVKTEGGGMGGVSEFSNLFAKVAKGRTGDLRSAVMMPDNPNTARFESQAHTAAKLSAGILTDSFNILQTAILGGADQIGEGTATALERIMLFINKGMAQKHGGGGAAGPLEFVETFARGPAGLKEISAGMDKGGDDIFGELGQFNKEYRERMYKMLIAQPKETIQQLAREVGVLEGEAEIGPENFIPVIKNLVDKLDLKGQFRAMWDMLEQNMKKALLAEGLSPGEVSATMDDMLKTINPKTKKPKGLDLRRLIKTQDPKFFATRGVGRKEVQKEQGVERVRKVLDLLGVSIGEEVQSAVDEFDIDEDPRELAQQAGRRVRAFFKKMSPEFQVANDEMLAITTGARGKTLKGIRGQHIPTPEGGPGEILISKERLVDPFLQALEEVEKMGRGEIPATTEGIIRLNQALAALLATLSHEGGHKVSKEYPEIIGELTRRIGTAGGDLNRHVKPIFAVLNKLANVKSAGQRLARITKAEQEGRTTYGGQPIAQAREEAAKRYAQVGVEELVMHRADPDRWQRLTTKASATDPNEIIQLLPDEVQDAVTKAYQAISSRSTAIIQPTNDFIHEITSLVIDSAKAALEGTSVQPVRDEVRQRIDDLAAGESYPGRENFIKSREVLSAGEKTLAFGRRTHGLASFEKVDGQVGSSSVDIPAEDLVGTLGGKLRGLIQTAAEGVDDPALASRLGEEFNEAAGQYLRALKNLGSDQYSGSAFRDYNKVRLEFQAAEAASIINRARKLEKEISEMRTQGKDDSPDFRDLLDRFDATVLELFRSYEKNINLRGKGRGTATGLAVTPDQLISEPAREMGIRPTSMNFQQILQSNRGRLGTEDASQFSGVVAPLEKLLEVISAGENATEQWTMVWDALVAKPEAFYENMVRVQEILAKWSRLKGLETDPFSKASLELKRLADEAGIAKKAMDKLGERPRSQADIDSLRASNKQFAGAHQRGRTGGSLATSIKEQTDNARAEAKRLERELTAAAQAGIDLPRHFEPRKIQIVDPSNNQVLHVLETQATRTGKKVDVSLRQAGRGAQAFGGNMRNALRRVVQWGMASGVVYGLVRAFRSLIGTVTTVESKIADLKKVMDTSVVNFEKLQDGAAGFAKEFGVSIDDVLDGMVVYGQQGLKTNEIMERTRATMLAVNVTTLSSTEATEALTAAHKVFGDSVSSSIAFVDAWGNVAAKHAITAADLADAVKRSGSAAQVAGVGFQDFLGVVTSIGAVTRQSGKEIATATKFMFRAMRRPTAQKELGQIGISSMQAGGDFRPAMDVLGELAGKWGSLTRAQQVNTAQAMAGIRHYNQFVVLMENFDQALLASSDAANSQGFALRKNRIAMTTMHKQMGVLKESVKGVALEIGKAFLPMATGAVNIVGRLVSVIGELPGPLLQVGTLFAGLGVVMGQGSRFLLDTLEAIGGQELGDQARGLGVIGTAKNIPSGLKSVGEAASLAATGGDIAEGSGAVARGVHKTVSGLGKMGEAVGGVLPGFSALSSLLGGTATAFLAAGVTITVVATALYGLYKAYQATYTNAKDFEQSMEDIIGRSEDAASALRAQLTQADRLTLSYKKFQSALDSLESPEAMKVKLDEGQYKSATVAAKNYSDMVADMSNNMALADPSKIEGITKFGDYVVGVSQNFKQLTQSALDAQNALTMALKTDVIAKYAEELKTAQGPVDNLKQALSKLGSFFTGDKKGTDQSALGKLKDINKEIEEETKKRRSLTDRGSFAGAGRLKSLAKQKSALTQEALGPAEEAKRVFESLPIFENMKTAMEALTPQMAEALGTVAETGVFGRGVDTGALVTSFMAKQSGLGGIIGPGQAISPALIAGTMHERGISSRGGAEAVGGAKVGEMAVIGSEVAEKLMAASIKGMDEMDASKVVSKAQTLFSELDNATGDILYRYFDATKNQTLTISAEALQAMVAGVESQGGDIANAFLRWSRNEVEEAAENTRKVLSLQHTGALAGIRQPSGGMPQIGPARFSEVSEEQRVLKELPVEMQRLADVQAELNNLTNQYSEDVLEDVASAYKGQGAAAKELKVMTNDVLQLATQLQKEGFNLTVLAHYSKAQHELNMVLEQAAEAARDAAAAERIRSKFDVESSGALAGKTKGVSFDFGKSMRELSGLDRARLELPGFDKYVQTLSSVERQKQQQIDTLIEVEKRKSRFDESVRDLNAAGENLTAEQMSKYLEARDKGVPPGDIAMIRQLELGDAMTKALMDSQLGVQESMLEMLSGINESAAISAEYTKKVAEIDADPSTTDQEKRQRKAEAANAQVSQVQKATRDKINQSEGNQLRRAIGKQFTSGQLDAVYKELFNISEKEGKLTAFGEGDFSGVSKEMRQSIANLMQAIDDVGARTHNSELMRPISIFNPATQRMEPKEFSRPDGTTLEQHAQNMSKGLDELISSAVGSGAAPALKEKLIKLTASGDFGSTLAQNEQEESLKRTAEIEQLVAKKRNEVYSAFEQEQLKQIAQIEQTNNKLKSANVGMMAIAANDLANTLDQMVKEFRKAELLQYDKIGSDLEGPGARVGQPGFRTEFENRRLDTRKEFNNNRPMTLDQMRARDEAVKQIDFDEKEAKIKQKQDIEVNALRQQQQQAESVMSTLADQLMSGTFAQDPGIENQIRNYIESLKGELITSEQAEVRGDDLFFKGIPGLEKVQSFAQQMRQEAQGKEKEAEAQLYRASIADPIVSATTAQTQAVVASQNATTAAVQSLNSTLGGPGSSVGGSSGVASINTGTGSSVGGSSGVASINTGTGQITAQIQKLDTHKTSASSILSQSTSQQPASSPGAQSLNPTRGPGKLALSVAEFQKEQAARTAAPQALVASNIPEGLPLTSLRLKEEYQNAKLKNQGPFQGIVPEEAYAGTGTVDFRKYFEANSGASSTAEIGLRSRSEGAVTDTAAVGITNKNIQAQVEARKGSGNPSIVPGSSIATTDQGIQGAASDPARRVNEIGSADTNASPNEALSSIAERLGALVESLAGMAEGGLQLPPSLENTLSAGFGTLEAALASTLTVNIENEPSVSISNIADIGTAASSAAASSLGADITEFGTRITQVEGLVTSGGVLETRLAELESTLSLETTERTAADEGLGARIDILDSMTEQLDPDALSTLTSQATDLNTAITDLDVRITLNEENIGTAQEDIITIQTALGNTDSSLSDFENRVTEVEMLSSEAITKIDDFGSTLNAFEETLSATESVSAGAQELAEEIRDSLTSLSNITEQQKQSLEAQVRDSNSNIAQVNTELNARKQQLQKIERVAANALTVAHNAMSIAQRRK